MDYLDQLDDTKPVYEMPDGTMVTELEFMAIFMAEDNNANFKHKGPKLITDPEERKKVYNKNNARNRCTYGITKARNLMLPKTHEELQGLIESEASGATINYVEDAMIDFLEDINDLSDSSNDTDK